MKSVLIFVVGIAAVSADSWDDYVDQRLVREGMKSAAIFGHDGTVWARNNVQPTTAETTKIVQQFNDPQGVSGSEINFGGVKYLGIKGDSGSIYGKKGVGGIIAVKTNQAVIVGTYDESLRPMEATHIVERLGDYFRDTGY